MSAHVAALLAACALTAAQPQGPNVSCSSAPPACATSVLECGPRRWPYYWKNVKTDLQQCNLPLEMRVGLTASLTGALSDPALTNDLLKTLTELQGLLSSSTSITAPFSFCLSFCVVDDESSPQRVVEVYRSFAGVGERSQDLLLGPASFELRAQAVQVAQEFRWPLILWSLSPLMGMNELATTRGSFSTTLSWIVSLITAQQRSFQNVFGVLSFSNTCESFSPPDGYALRPDAKFLPCDGPCQAQRDRDYCAIELQSLAVLAEGPEKGWWPPEVLRSPPWQDGCLETTEVSEPQMDIQLRLPMPVAPVVVEATGSGYTLVLGGTVYKSSPGAVWLRDGVRVLYAGTDPEETTSLKICMRQSCSFLECPEGWVPMHGAYCSTTQCSNENDVSWCCTFGAPAAPWGGAESILDMGIPPSLWLLDALPRLYDSTDRAQLLVCIAQAGEPYVDLCKAHVEHAVTLGFRSTAMPSVDVSVGLQYAIAQLQLMRPPPGVILVCSEMPLYSRFIHALASSQLTFPWVLSCFPFGRELQGTNRGTMLTHNFVEALPWPPLASLLEVEQAVEQELSRLYGVQFGNLTSLVSQISNLSMQMVNLRASVQMMFRVVRNAFSTFEEDGVSLLDEPPITVAITVIDKLLTSLLYGSTNNPGAYFPTYLGHLDFDYWGHRLVDRWQLGTRVFTSLQTIQSLSDTDSISISESWIYEQARHFFSSFREYSGQTPLLALPIAQLSSKMSETYPCPTGCSDGQLACWACPPGSFRQPAGVACSPCPANNSMYQDSWAGEQCFSCPVGAICESTSLPPVAARGYVRLLDTGYEETYGIFNGPEACSTGPGGGLALLHARDLTRWQAAKQRSRWYIKACTPAEACIGNNECAPSHEGRSCAGCKASSTKFTWWFAKWNCSECPSQPVAPTLIMAAIQVFCVVVISAAVRSSAWSEHSLAGPAVLAFLRVARLHAFLTDLTVEPLHEEDMTVPMWAATSSQVFFSPFLLPLISCLIPFNTANLNIYILMIFASGLCIVLMSAFVVLCTSRRLDAVIGSLYAGLQMELPSMAFNALRLITCSEDEDGYHLLLNADENCPGFVETLALPLTMLSLSCMVLQWLALPYILRGHMYVQTRERYGLAFLKLLPGKRYWKILDDLVISLPSSAALFLGRDAAAYCFLAMEGMYAFLVVSIQPFSFLQNNALVRLKNSLGVNLVSASTAILFTDFVLAYLVEVLEEEVSLDNARLIMTVVIMGISLIHMVVTIVLVIFENRVASVVNMVRLAQPPSNAIRRLFRFVQCFGSAQSMVILKQGNVVIFDAKEVPARYRKIFMNGVASALTHIIFKSTVLQMDDVRDMVSSAVDKIIQARHVGTMRRMNAVAGQRGFSKEVDMEFEEFLESDLIASFELVTTVEDMCCGNMEHTGQAAKRPAQDVEEDFDWEDLTESTTRRPTAVFRRRFQARAKYDKKVYKKLTEGTMKLSERMRSELEHMERRLSNMWMSSANDDSGRLMPHYLAKVEAWYDLLDDFRKHVRYVKKRRDEEDFNVETDQFLRTLAAKLSALVPEAETKEEELDGDCRAILGAEIEPSAKALPIFENMSRTTWSTGPTSAGTKLSFSRLDFRSTNQPASSPASALVRTFDE